MEMEKITNSLTTVRHRQYSLIHRDSVVQELQSSIGAVSTNLLSAYQKMAENMERSMQMMSNANKMMESFVLQNLDIRMNIPVSLIP